MKGWSNARLSGWLRNDCVGHEERFPPTKLSAGCGFRQETIAGMRRNGRDAPIVFSNGSWSCKNGAAGYQVVVIIGVGEFST